MIRHDNSTRQIVAASGHGALSFPSLTISCSFSRRENDYNGSTPFRMPLIQLFAGRTIKMRSAQMSLKSSPWLVLSAGERSRHLRAIPDNLSLENRKLQRLAKSLSISSLSIWTLQPIFEYNYSQVTEKSVRISICSRRNSYSCS